MIISLRTSFDPAEVGELYDSVGWSAYTRDLAKLVRSLTGSPLVITARDESGELLGLARTVSDDETVCYVQDLLVRPAAQRPGIGRALLQHLDERYPHCRSFLLTTDRGSTEDGRKSRAFYRTFELISPEEQELAVFVKPIHRR
ncbi:MULTISPECIES: GNAT family N-acetyltransferase [Actinoalloteichus]|uniref:Acetyltransferase (GNAT) domain n=1 Tax=Actinoalloteichus fjordicus TaxID=1612552 RepID=A0AAC9L9D3_9PSEU|nr:MULTISPECIES: GNAT family N-acetyltransferase [Actinoalloteichus]APU12720.1 Acetyltransferase (GNAT) domain [Actinoalloteichus fjordicus]APU18690.1 Acetyltransferase (GNAT) domain [Actinoalloteichus sp. GBA129-24]